MRLHEGEVFFVVGGKPVQHPVADSVLGGEVGSAAMAEVVISHSASRSSCSAMSSAGTFARRTSGGQERALDEEGEQDDAGGEEHDVVTGWER